MKKVSVIVPIYNVEKYIEKCVRSLFEQTYENVEYIFVNDCTPDNSMKILEKLINEYDSKKEKTIVINKEKNGGLPQARKTGFEKSTGDYILHIDSDDWIELNMAEELMKKAAEDNCDMVWCDYYENDKYINACSKHSDAINIINELFGFSYGAYVWNKLVKREIYQRAETYFPFASQNEDFVITAQHVCYAEKIGFVNKALYHYLIRNTSLSFDKKRLGDRANEERENLIWVLNFLKNRYGENLEIFEPYLSYRMNYVKMKLLEVKKTRNTKVPYDFYPQSLKRIFKTKYKYKRTFVQAVFLFLASKGILFQYKLFDWFNWRRIKGN